MSGKALLEAVGWATRATPSRSCRIGTREVPLIAPDPKKWQVEYYRMSPTADDDRAALVGFRVGDLLFIGPDDVFPADLIWIKLGKDVPKSFVNYTCAHYGYCSRGIPLPSAGAVMLNFSRKDRLGGYRVPVLCVRCGSEFYVAWDTDPRR